MKTYAGLLITILLFQACNVVKSDEKTSKELIQRDLEFSKHSRQNGLGKAFTQFADSAAVLLKPDRMPIKGAMSIAYYYANINDDNLELTWMPLDASVADSKDLGYTYGVWQLTSLDSMRQGTYVTIWKKNQSGVWKYVLDAGNEGIGNIE